MAINVPRLTAPERLALLLPWLNGDDLSRSDIVGRLLTFTATAAGGDLLGLTAEPHGAVTDGDLRRLRRAVLAVIASAVPGAPDAKGAVARRGGPVWTSKVQNLASLRFAVTRSKGPDKVSTLSADERRAYLGGSAYLMTVTGRPRDIVLYAVMRTLTEPGAVLLAQCPAPSAEDAARPCHRWFVIIGARRGRPADYCSTLCRVRRWKRHQQQQQGKGER